MKSDLHPPQPGFRQRRRLIAGLVGAVFSARSGAQIYSGADERGAVVLSNFPSDVTPELVVEAPIAPAASGPAATPIPEPDLLRARAAPTQAPLAIDINERVQLFRPLIDRIAREQSVSAPLLHAVIRVESGYQDKVVSAKGAIGLMQLMPDTARRFGVQDAFDARQNVEGGARYLRWLLEFFRGDLNLALAGYNAGEAAVIRAGYRIPAIAETLEYVPKVLWHLRHFGRK